MNHPLPSFDEALSAAFPSVVPSEALVQRIAALPVAATQSRLRRVVRVSLASAAAFVAVASTAFLAPKAEAMSALAHIASAVDALGAWHLLTYTPNQDGKLEKTGETWCLDGLVRDESERGKLVRFTSPREAIEYRTGEAAAVRLTNRRDADLVRNLRGMIQEMQRSVWMQNVAVDNNLVVDGRSATRVRAESKIDGARITLYADTKTQIPFLGLAEVRSSAGWRVIRRVEIDTAPIDRGKLEFRLPKGMPVVDFAAMTARWAERLSHPIATYKGDFDTLAIRDVWINEDGVVFLLYTNGTRPYIPARGWKHKKGPNGEDMRYDSEASTPIRRLDLEGVAVDGRATRYVAGPLISGVIHFEDGKVAGGIVLGADDLMAAICVPAQQTDKRPRELRFIFEAVHSAPAPGWKPHGKVVSISEMVRVVDKRIEYVQNATPQIGQIPPWMPYIGTPVGDDQLRAEEARARCKDALTQNDPVRAEQQAREWIRITQLMASSKGWAFSMASHYNLLGQALQRQGRYGEARAAWSRALDDVNWKPDRERIERQLASLPAPPR